MRTEPDAHESVKKPVTQADVAKAANVHRTTVSLALKNHPGLPEKTRKRIQKTAAKLGYSPDPMLSALNAHRGRWRKHTFQGTLAWLVNTEGGWDWTPAFREYHEGAVECAKLYGFNIEVFDRQKPGMTSARLASIFAARNIRGVLVVPQPRPNMEWMDFPWGQFSAVAFGYSLKKPQLHMVGAAQFRGMSLMMHKLNEGGFRRIGIISTPAQNERVDRNYIAAYLADEYIRNGMVRIPPLENIGNFQAWYREHRPDAIVLGSGNYHLSHIREAGLRVPENVGVATPFLSSRHEKLSGVYENSVLIGSTAVAQLVAMIQHGERGIPQTPHRTLIDGIWMPGTTLQAGS